MSRRKKRLPVDPVLAQIESLSHEGRGIAHLDGKITFIGNALPGEELMFKYTGRRSRFDEGIAVEILKPSPDRIEPRCQHYGVCGGCSLQHMDSEAQIHHKQTVLMQQFEHIGQVQPEVVIPPLLGPMWGYRRKARLGVKYVEKKAKVLIGFREIYSRFVADLDQCEVLHESVGKRLPALQELVAGLSVYKQLPQIEVAISDDTTALVLRHLQPLTEADQQRLLAFEQQHQVEFYLQPAGPDSVTKLNPQNNGLAYRLPDYDIEILFHPTDFTQVNTDINRSMVKRVIDLLQINSNDYILELFCGLGNFTLPMARYAGNVTGVEGDAGLIERARFNAMHNRIINTEFVVANLADEAIEAEFLHKSFNKILLDPPRSGAAEIIQRLNLDNVECIVYVSCNPATLARDAGILVNDKGFRLRQAGVMDMFPHTAHVESLAVFER